MSGELRWQAAAWRHCEGHDPGPDRASHGFGPALDKCLCGEHMCKLARSYAESERTQTTMGAGMAIAADNQGARQAQSKFGSDDMDDTLSRLIDIEHLNASGRGLDPERRQQFLPYLAGASTATCGGYGMVRRGKRQFRIVNPKATALEIKQSAGATQIVQQMTINVKEVGIFAYSRNDVLVPDLGEQRSAGHFQRLSSLRRVEPAAPAATAALRGFCKVSD